MDDKLTELIYKIDKRRKIFVRVLIIFVLIVSAFLFVVLYNEAISLPEKYAGRELYQKRIDDAFIYAGITSLVIFIFVIPVIILINSFFIRYKDILMNMSKDSLSEFYYYHDNILKGFNKLKPPYIINSNKLIVLKLFSSLEIKFEDIKNIRLTKYKEDESIYCWLNITTYRDNYKLLLNTGNDLYSNKFINYSIEKIKSKNNKIDLLIK